MFVDISPKHIRGVSHLCLVHSGGMQIILGMEVEGREAEGSTVGLCGWGFSIWTFREALVFSLFSRAPCWITGKIVSWRWCWDSVDRSYFIL
jgi:hypothetical protein